MKLENDTLVIFGKSEAEEEKRSDFITPIGRFKGKER